MFNRCFQDKLNQIKLAIQTMLAPPSRHSQIPSRIPIPVDPAPKPPSSPLPAPSPLPIPSPSLPIAPAGPIARLAQPLRL